MSTYLTNTTIKQVVDRDTGELHEIETSKTYRTKVETDRFFSVYISKLASFYGITALSDVKVMIAFCEMAEYDTGVLNLNKAIRVKIQDKTGVDYSNLSKNIKRLSNLGLIHHESGTVTINPEIFWKGSMKVRRELLNIGGLQFKVELYSEDD